MRGIGCPLGGSQLWSYFRRLWTKVHQITFACVEVSIVSIAVFRLTMSCCVPEIFVIKSQSCAKSRQNFHVFGPTNFGGKGPPNFLTEFYKSWTPSNMSQNLVTIGQATCEIRRQKKKKTKNLNYSSKT